ncbi:carbohydrate binding domain protein [Minicystis rosea]|nr:carbohydrate binding domain protein [Minicystis rosea]
MSRTIPHRLSQIGNTLRGMKRTLPALLSLLVGAYACGSNTQETTTDGSTSGTTTGHGGHGAETSSTGSQGGKPGTGGQGGSGAAEPDGGDPDSGNPGACEPFGRFPAPTSTFTITEADRDSDGGLYMPDIQAKFPQVDWAHLDRLYIQAGQYRYIRIVNLPTRTADKPLVITNKGGQVRVGPAPSETFGYLWIMGGGSNWVLTGRYDPEAQTGDVGFQGHRCGKYGSSRGHYGFLSDDEFTGFPVPQSHMGILVDKAASAYELEFLEITRSTFAGIRLFTPDGNNTTGTLPPYLDDVRVHDNYVHDTGGEGLYLGSTASGVAHTKFRRLKIYNNRVMRAANEVPQLQQLGPDTEVYNNVFAFGGLNWKNGFEQDQDNASQALFREGPIDIHHNIFIGGMESLGNYFGLPESGDGGGKVTIRNNYFAETMWLGFYMGSIGQLANGPGSEYHFVDNVFRGLDHTQDYGYFHAPYYTTRNLNQANYLFQLGTNWTAPFFIEGNTWEGQRKIIYNPPSFVTQSNNTNAAVAPVVFQDLGLPAGTEPLSLQLWAASSAAWAGGGPIVYAPGDLVFDMGHLYRCTKATSAGATRPFKDTSGSWEDLGMPADDVRLAPSSPHAGIGLLEKGE